MLDGQTHRLASGGLIDRSRRVTFTFDDLEYTGYEVIRSLRR